LVIAIAQSAPEMPYHPYRKVENRYYGVATLYNGGSLTNWIVARNQADDWRVAQVIPSGLLIERTTHTWSGYLGTSIDRTRIYFLTNFPLRSRVVDGQRIDFIALKTGTFQYPDAMGAVRTVEKLDYGVPYDPAKLAAEAKTNQPSSTVRKQ
jgi:hypothetical protein